MQELLFLFHSILHPFGTAAVEAAAVPLLFVLGRPESAEKTVPVELFRKKVRRMGKLHTFVIFSLEFP